LRAGLAAPNRVWDLNPWFPLGGYESFGQAFPYFEPADAQDRSSKNQRAAGMIQIEI
jgi:hypothetical protein